MVSLNELKDRARRGDADALRELREQGFFSRRASRAAYPVADAQRRLWVLDQMNPQSSTYNVPAAIRITGALDVAALERALAAVVNRHEALRTAVAMVDGEVRQIVDAGTIVPLTHISLQDRADPAAAARAWLAADAAEPFTLASAPLLRAALLSLASDDHVFACTLHHIICDGWSLQVLVQDLLTAYASCVAGLDELLPPLRIQYKDVAAWQRQRIERGELESARRYWLDVFAAEAPAFELPADVTRPAVQTFAGDHAYCDLPPATAAAIEQVSMTARATVFMTLLAATRVLLFRYSGQADVIIGTPVAGRGHSDLEDQVGFHVNLLPLRTVVRPRDTFLDTLASVRAATLAAYQHEYPFDRLVDDLNLPRDLSRSPLFDVLVTLDEAAPAPRAPHGLTVDSFAVPADVAKYDLTFFFSRGPGSLHLTLTYNRALYTRERMERLVEHLVDLLGRLVARPSTPIRELPIGTAEELRRIEQDFASAPAPYPHQAGIAAAFDAQAAATPQADAVCFAAADGRVERLTYAELQARANRVAAAMRARGVGVETRVAVALERSSRVAVALLGILKAGGCYVPLELAAPASRREFVIADAGCALVLDDALLAELEAEPSPRVQALPQRITGRNLACIMYTSGSTGEPKGALIEQRAVLRLVRSTNYLQLGPADRVLQTGALAFDASTWEIWGPLLNGGCVCFASAEDMLLARSVRDLIVRHRVTCLWVTASLLNQWVDDDVAMFSGLRALMAGGERLSPAHIRRLRQQHPGLVVINGYGPTENTTFTACHRIDAVGDGEIPIGRPIANTDVSMLDEWGGACGIGVAGEICAGGDGLARGYLNQPALTAERFVPHPTNPGARLYRTGDRGRWRADGTIEFLGRHDAQLKVRGFRIEPGEIEARLRQHPAVDDAVVIGRRQDGGGMQLVGYYAGDAAASSAIRAHLDAVLPPYLVPSHLVALPRLPLTRNGKVDRAALPDPAAAAGRAGGTAPRTPLEHALCDIWQAVLDVPAVGVEDNFFALGGHSLTATRVLTRIHRELTGRVTLRDLFARPTVAALAERIGGAGASPRAAIPRVPDADDYPASAAQRRLWLLQRLSVDSGAYNVPGAVVLTGAVDATVLSRAFTRLVARHETLRTSFAEIDGTLRQRIHAPFPVSIPVVDLSGAELPAEEARGLVAADAAEPFDLTRAPMFRVALYRLAPERHVFSFNIHHIVTDGWSMRVLLDDLIELYEADRHGRADTLPPLAIQYRDYAAWQRERLGGDEEQAHRQYWVERFGDEVPALDLPADAPRPPVQTFAGGVVRLQIDPGIVGRLRALGQEHGATLYGVLLTLVRVLVNRHTSQEEFVLGTGVSGREHADLERQAGFYVNMLPLRQRLAGGDSFVAALERTRATLADALDHQAYPFDLLVSDLQLRREAGRQPLFDIVVTLEEAERANSGVGGLQVAPFDLPAPFSKFDLMFAFACARDGACSVALEFSTDLFRRDRIERMAGHLTTLVASVLATPASAVEALNLLPARERQLLARFAGEASQYPAEKTIAELFEEQVARTPDAPAVMAGERVLSYRELNTRANVAAHALRARGVGPEDRVGVRMERSERVAVALLAILKAGGAYVPLDPNAPEQRTEFIVRDCECRLVLNDDDLALLESVAHPSNDLSLPSAADGRRLAYVMYTSGSTGQPKGTLIEQRSVVRLVRGANYLQLDGRDRMLQTGSLAFDASTLEIWGPLLNGGCACFAPADALLDAARVRAAVERHGVTAMFVTTSLFNQLVDADPGVFAGLRSVMTGGEKVSVAHINRIRQRHPDLALLHVYGPTENTTFTTYFPVEHEHTHDVPIGYPVANTTVFVLDRGGELAPIGVAGEICTGGDGLARGYLNRAALTAERFVPAPTGAGERLYRTGDIGRWSPAGAIEFLGRLDNQVKIRGYRVEPEEIEARLLQHPGVLQAAVLTRETTVRTRELVAYLAAGEGTSVSDVRAHLAATLPAYMVPADIVLLPELPLNRNGKIDRHALTSAMRSAMPVTPDDVAWEEPRTEEERTLAAVWEAVLGRGPIGRAEHYFDAGGDSIRAIQIVNRLRKSGWSFDVRDVFQFPVLGDAALRLHRAAAPPSSTAPAGPVPLTPIQRWFLQRPGDRHHFNHAMLLDCPGDLQPGILGGVVDAIVAHHPALRYVLTVDAAGNPAGLLDVARPRLEVRDLRESTTNDWRAEIDAVQKGFDLVRGPLFRAVLYQRPDHDRLLLIAHHLIVDGVSWRILLEDLEQSYTSMVSGAAPVLTPATHSYADWVQALVGRASALPWDAAHAFWGARCHEPGGVLERDIEAVSYVGAGFSRPATDSAVTLTGRLKPAPTYDTPANTYADSASNESERRETEAVGAGFSRPAHDQVDRERAIGNTYGDCASVEVSLSAEVTREATADVHSAFGTGIDDLLLTALGRALGQFHGGEQTWVAMEGHGRDSVPGIDAGGAVGWFTSLHPFLLRIEGANAADQLRHVKEALRLARRHAAGYTAMRWLEGRPALDVPEPDCRISFNFMGQVVESRGGAFSWSDDDAGVAISPSLQRDHDFEIGGIVRHGQLTLSVTFNPLLHAEQTARRLLDAMTGELHVLLAACRSLPRGARTPSDLTACPLALAEYDALLAAHGWSADEIEDVYPLTPMQQGLLFQSLLDRESRAYFLQLTFRLIGPLDVELFREAWREVARRHAVLRAAIVHEALDTPLQVILASRRPEFWFEDLSAFDRTERDRLLDDQCAADLARGVDLQHESLTRIGVIRVADDAHHVVWSYHHVMLDGWSLGVLYPDVLAVYGALCTGRALPQVESRPFSAYVAWLLEQDAAAARQYWIDYLRGCQPVDVVEPMATALDAGVDAAAAPAAGETSDDGEYTLTIDRDLTARLMRLAADANASLNTTMQALWAVLVARYVDAPEVIFGAVVSGRPAALRGVEEMVGLFINTVPVRAAVDPAGSFAALLQRMQADALAAEPFHFFPLADIQQANACLPERLNAVPRAAQPLFDHLLVFENYPVGESAGTDDAPGLRVESFAAHDRTHYALDLTIVPGEALQVRFNYGTRFSGRAIARLAAAFGELASAVVQAPEERIARLPIMNGAERERVLAAGRGREVAYPVDLPLHAHFEDVAARLPDAVAVRHGTRSTSYAELNARANRIAHWLRDAGVGRGDFVALLEHRGSDLIAAMLGVLKAGAVFLPIDPAYPPDRVRYMLEHSAARVVISRGELLAQGVAGRVALGSPPADPAGPLRPSTNAPGALSDVEGHGTRTAGPLRGTRLTRPVLDLDGPALARCADGNPSPTATSRDVAYLLYTSGSTGLPKGAMVRHDGAVNHIFAEFDLLQFHAGSAFLQSAPCSSDIAVWQCLAPGLIGGRVVIADYEDVLDPSCLLALLQRERVTLFELVPVVLRALLDHAATLTPEARALPDLEWGMVTGEAAPVALVNQWCATYPAVPLVNAYGPTEAADDISQEVIRGGLAPAARTVPIGRPLPNLRMFVLDAASGLVPFGVIGEICVSGVGVGAGYWHDDERTAAAFVESPYAEHERDRVLYRTGDRGRWRADGALECLGRLDQQIKLRGVRIEVEEIESRLLECEGVGQAAVGIRDVGGEPTLVAWIVGEIDDKGLRARLAGTLPAALVPTRFVPMPALPLLPNGKIDRRACPDPPPAERQAPAAAPSTDVERRLAAIWIEVLQVPAVGIDDDFFAVGGHSLKAMQVVSRIHREFGTAVPLPEFFATPTISALALRLGDTASSDTASGRIPAVASAKAGTYAAIPRVAAADDYELSHAQKRLWLLHHLDGRVAYNMPEAVILHEPVERAALQRALATLVERHEVLRTAFVLRDGEPRQRILDAVALPIREVDLTHIADADVAAAKAAQLAAAEAAVPFDLATPPLVRAVLYRLSPTREVFLLVIHHIVGDGWSMNVLYREVLALYGAYRHGAPDPLKPLPIQYRDFSAWQNAQDFTVEEQYWVTMLAGAPDRLALPTDTATAGDRDFRGRTEEGRIDAATVARLQAVAHEHRATLSTVMLSLFGLLLFQWTRQADLCIGLAIANRSRLELENLLGFFVNILPIRLQVAADMEFAALLEQVKARTTEAFEHQEYPFDRLVQVLNPGRDGNRQPVLNVIYTFQNFEDVHIDVGARPAAAGATGGAAAAVSGAAAPAGALVEPFAVPFETAKFDLTLFVTEMSAELRLSLEYDVHLFSRDTIRRVIETLERFAGMLV